MSESTSTLSPIEGARGASSLGGFNLTALRLEVTRVLRNKRTLFFIVVFPAIFFFLYGMGDRGPDRSGALAYVMISIAVYGAMSGNTSGGASVAVERSLGWSRQLRLTPLTPAAYVCIKVMAAMTLGLFAVCSTFALGLIYGVRMPLDVWLLSGVLAFLCSSVFAAFGLFVGFLFPAENVMQFVGPLMALMAMFGGLFVPLRSLSPTMQTIARYTPMYGPGVVARSPLTHDPIGWGVASVVVWALIFVFGAVLVFRRDTARV
ncbi:MAG: ABC transporter permease [Gemmatimonas sp.]